MRVDRLMGLSISPIVKLGLNELDHIWAARFLAPFREAKSTTENRHSTWSVSFSRWPLTILFLKHEYMLIP
jgi:hypothetical protein